MRKILWAVLMLGVIAAYVLSGLQYPITAIVVEIILIIIWFEFIDKKAPAGSIISREIKRSTGDGTEVTDDELEYLKSTQCPDCDDHAFLWEGPSGGACTNYLCPCCGSKFNVGAGLVSISKTEAATAFWAQRINAGSRTPGFNEPDLSPRIKQAYLESKQSSIVN